MGKILIAIDYDESAQRVAKAGYELAKAMNAEVILLHVLHEKPSYYIESSSVYEMHISHLEDLKLSIQKFMERTKKHLGDKSILTIIEEGEIAETIITTAKRLGADVIVMGTHSRKWPENIIIGSDAKAVLKKATIPLYIVPIKNYS